MKLISIIIPVYNTDKYLSKCLDSIIAQTYHNWEAILVDDGSKDDSGKICDEYAAKDSRFKDVHKANEGVSIARLIAFNHCSGEYVTFVDSDDYIADSMLQIMAGYIEEYLWGWNRIPKIRCCEFSFNEICASQGDTSYGEETKTSSGNKGIRSFNDDDFLP